MASLKYIVVFSLIMMMLVQGYAQSDTTRLSPDRLSLSGMGEGMGGGMQGNEGGKRLAQNNM